MTFANIMAGILFGGVGFVAFAYGKKQGKFKVMSVGIVLMVYPYLIANTILLYLVGALLTSLLFVIRE